MMFQKILNRKRDKKMLLSDGVKVSTSYNVIVNNDDVRYFENHKSALDFIESYRNTNQIFNLSVFRVEFYSLVSQFN